MAEQERARDDEGKTVAFYRGLVRRRGPILRVEGFTEERAARLIFAKLLYLRGTLRG